MSTSTDTNKEIHEEKQEKCKTKDLIYIDPQQSVVHETVTLRDQSRNKINIDSDEKLDHHNDDEENIKDGDEQENRCSVVPKSVGSQRGTQPDGMAGKNEKDRLKEKVSIMSNNAHIRHNQYVVSL